MSDHVLLASAVHGGLASEALLPLLNWWHTKTTGGQRAAGGGVVAAVGAGAGVGSFDAVQCRLRKLEGPVSQHLNAAAVLAASNRWVQAMAAPSCASTPQRQGR